MCNRQFAEFVFIDSSLCVKERVLFKYYSILFLFRSTIGKALLLWYNKFIMRKQREKVTLEICIVTYTQVDIL